jgi:hypothetical protein
MVEPDCALTPEGRSRAAQAQAMTVRQAEETRREVRGGLEALAGMPERAGMVAEIVAKASLKTLRMQEMSVRARNFHSQCSD